MNRSKKIWLGVLTISPLLFIGIYIVFAIAIAILAESSGGGEDAPALFWLFFTLMFLSIIIALVIIFGVMIYFLMHASNDKTLSQENRLVWILVLIFANGIGTIVYWYIRIWSNPEA